MAGLLDVLNSEQGRLGLGLLAAAGGRSDGAGFGQRMAEGIGSVDQWKKQQAQAKFQQMQADEMQAQVEARKAKAIEDARIKALIQGVGQPQAGMGGNPQEAGKIDYQSLMRQGVPYELIKNLADSQNLGREEVTGWQNTGGKLVPTTKYGLAAGVNPMMRESSPEALLTDERTRSEGGLNRALTMRGQNMTDSRARDLNAITQGNRTEKANEKQSAADLAKSNQVASFDVMLDSVSRLAKHPGLTRSVGVTGAFPTMPGSESANFKAELDTFQSQAFIPMVAQLKGMGALSDAEGKKLTAAVGALNPNMGEAAFRQSLDRIKNDMTAARARLTGENTGGASGSFGEPMSSMPPAQQHKGRTIRDTVTGKTMTSNGMTWVESK